MSDKKEKRANWLKEKRDVIVVSLALLFIAVLVLAGILFRQESNRDKEKEKAAKAPKLVSIDKDKASQTNNPNSSGSSSKQPVSYFLKPAAGEVLEMITEAGEADLPVANQKYTGLRVMWPVYFFQVLSQEGSLATVIFDVSEDGFGAVVQAEIDMSTYPEIASIKRGRKVWVAGEIRGVEVTGTGTIHIGVDELRFQESLMDAIKGTPLAE